MRRATYEDPPVPPAASSKFAGCLLAVTAAAAGCGGVYAKGNLTVGVVVASSAAGLVIVASVAVRGRRSPAGRRSRTQPVSALIVSVGLAGLYLTRPALLWLLLGLAALPILGGLIRRYRVHERNEVVKPPPPAGSPEEVGERWAEFRRRAGLGHPDDADVAAELVRDPAPNGVGGIVLRVDLRDAQLLPEDLTRAAEKARRVLRFDVAFVRRIDTDTTDLHLYRGTPLGERTGWEWLAAHPAAQPERVTIGPTVTAEPATIHRRRSVGWFGLTDTGKTGGQLATVHSLTAVQRLPVHLLVLDNREVDNRGGSELRVLSGLPGVTYRNKTQDAWELILRGLDIMGERQAGKGRIGDLSPDDEHPHVRLMITELLDVLQSRPPSTVQDWAGYTRGLFDRRPPVNEWRGMLAENLAKIVRTGRDVEVVLDFCAQAGQIDQIPGVLRRMLPTRVLFRVGNASDIAPVLGDAAGVDAHQIPEWQQGACYVLAEDGRPVFARTAHVAPDDLEAAVVAPLRTYGRRLLYVVDSAAGQEWS